MVTIPFALRNQQDFSEAVRLFQEFCQVVAALRDPINGCPWDLEQSHDSLRSFMIEEACEASQAMEAGIPSHIVEELGDVLLQVVLNAQLGADQKTFSLADVIRSILAKMIRRHPHVFGGIDATKKSSAEEVLADWSKLKEQERRYGSRNGAGKGKKGYFEEAGMAKVFPATTQAAKIGKLARAIEFDWDGSDPVFSCFLSEVEELRQELSAEEPSAGRIKDELGDLYFSLAQLCRHLKLDPELVASGGNQKFLRRFRALEQLAEEKGIDIRQESKEGLEALWKQAKALERKK